MVASGRNVDSTHPPLHLFAATCDAIFNAHQNLTAWGADLAAP